MAVATPRINVIADAALALLAERGMRGLTHRAVDDAAGLPQGSTSNHARTRAALLALTVHRLADREARAVDPAAFPAPGDGPDRLARLLAQGVRHSVTAGRDLARARLELAMEAMRDPALREVYDRAGRTFLEQLAALLAAQGAPEPERQARALLAWCEGTIFYAVAGAGSAAPPSEAELRASAAEFLNGILGGGRGR